MITTEIKEYAPTNMCYGLLLIRQLQHADVSCITSAKELFCHPYININVFGDWLIG